MVSPCRRSGCCKPLAQVGSTQGFSMSPGFQQNLAPGPEHESTSTLRTASVHLPPPCPIVLLRPFPSTRARGPLHQACGQASQRHSQATSWGCTLAWADPAQRPMSTSGPPGHISHPSGQAAEQVGEQGCGQNMEGVRDSAAHPHSQDGPPPDCLARVSGLAPTLLPPHTARSRAPASAKPQLWVSVEVPAPGHPLQGCHSSSPERKEHV